MKYLPLIGGRIKNRPLTEIYIQALLKELDLHKLRSFPLQIQFSRVLDDCIGLCEGSKKYVMITIATYDEGRKLTYLEMMRTLAHELVHARQFIRGQLNASLDGWKWKGRFANNYEYTNQPWEKEAYRLEKILFLKCFPLDATFNQ